MIEKWKRELLCGGEGILTQLGVLAAAGGVGMGLALFLCLANHFEEYFTAGPILQIVIVSFCALLGYQDMVCRFNRAVSFQESRRGFLAAYLPVEYALLAAQLILINVWSFLEQAVESRLIGGRPAFPPFRIGFPEILLWPALLLGAELFFGALVMRFGKYTRNVLAGLFFVLIVFAPQYMELQTPGGETVAALLLGFLGSPWGLLAAAAAGAVLGTAGAALLLRQRVTG